MTIANHYTTLGLVPTAAPEVIRASYKALALICHPDKTLNLATGERANHAAGFKDVQAAYDVLGNASLKAAYDAKLARRNSQVYGNASSHTATKATPTLQRKPSVKISTPLEKAAARAKARQSLEFLRVKRAEGDDVDERMDPTELKAMVDIWSELADENKSNPAMHAHCTIRVFEYNQKLAEREQQHTEWLAKMSSAKRTSTPAASCTTLSTSSSSTSRTGTTHSTVPDTSPTLGSRTSARAEERKRAEAERVAAATARQQARALEKTQRKAARQAHLD